MTTTIMTRSVAAPEYFCEACQAWHTGACPAGGSADFARVLAAINSHRSPRTASVCSPGLEPAAALGAHLLAVVRAQDAAIPTDRRAPRTVAEMQARLATLYEEEQDACPVCTYWRCRCGQASTQAPAAGSTAGTTAA
ncbi:hypothetical protein [Streptomyces collinus]|uniref:hypothetical protein n=1 Tax=Streptomyces collinus TaxID=42684 RepID=UPI0036B5EB09